MSGNSTAKNFMHKSRGEISLTLSILGIVISFIGIAIGSAAVQQQQNRATEAQSGGVYQSILEIRDEQGNVIDYQPGMTWRNEVTGAENPGDSSGALNTNGKARLVWNPTEADYPDELNGARATVDVTIPGYEVVDTFCVSQPQQVCNQIETSINPARMSNILIQRFVSVEYGWIVRPIQQPPVTQPPVTQPPVTQPPQAGEGDLTVVVEAMNYPQQTRFWDRSHPASQRPNSCSRLNNRPLYHSSFTLTATCVSGSCTPGERTDLRVGSRKGAGTYENLPAGEYRLGIKDVSDRGFDIWNGCRNETWTVRPGQDNLGVILLANREGEVYETDSPATCSRLGGRMNNIWDPINEGTSLCYYPNGRREPDPTQQPPQPDPGGEELVCSRQCIYSEDRNRDEIPECYTGACPANRPDCGGNTPQERIDNGNRGCESAQEQCGQIPQRVSCQTGLPINPTSPPGPDPSPSQNRGDVEVTLTYEPDPGDVQNLPIRVDTCDEIDSQGHNCGDAPNNKAQGALLRGGVPKTINFSDISAGDKMINVFVRNSDWGNSRIVETDECPRGDANYNCMFSLGAGETKELDLVVKSDLQAPDPNPDPDQYIVEIVNNSDLVGSCGEGENAPFFHPDINNTDRAITFDGGTLANDKPFGIALSYKSAKFGDSGNLKILLTLELDDHFINKYARVDLTDYLNQPEGIKHLCELLEGEEMFDNFVKFDIYRRNVEQSLNELFEFAIVQVSGTHKKGEIDVNGRKARISSWSLMWNDSVSSGNVIRNLKQDQTMYQLSLAVDSSVSNGAYVGIWSGCIESDSNINNNNGFINCTFTNTGSNNISLTIIPADASNSLLGGLILSDSVNPTEITGSEVEVCEDTGSADDACETLSEVHTRGSISAADFTNLDINSNTMYTMTCSLTLASGTQVTCDETRGSILNPHYIVVDGEGPALTAAFESQIQRTDLDENGQVNTRDIAILLPAYRSTTEGDINGDGETNALDYSIVIQWLGEDVNEFNALLEQNLTGEVDTVEDAEDPRFINFEDELLGR